MGSSKSYVESGVIYRWGRGGPGPSVFQTDGSGGCVTSLDGSLITKSISMVTIRWVKRMHDGSLMTESISMLMFRWVRRMTSLDRSLIMELIGIRTIRWVRRMRDGSLMMKSIGMVTIQWVKRMRDGSMMTEKYFRSKCFIYDCKRIF